MENSLVSATWWKTIQRTSQNPLIDKKKPLETFYGKEMLQGLLIDKAFTSGTCRGRCMMEIIFRNFLFRKYPQRTSLEK